jgi:hypothetical protein
MYDSKNSPIMMLSNNKSADMLKHQCTCCGKLYGNARGLVAHRSCNIKCSHDFGIILRSSLSAPQNTAFGAQNHAFGQDTWTMTRRCRGAEVNNFDFANKVDDTFGITLDPELKNYHIMKNTCVDKNNTTAVWKITCLDL